MRAIRVGRELSSKYSHSGRGIAVVVRTLRTQVGFGAALRASGEMPNALTQLRLIGSPLPALAIIAAMLLPAHEVALRTVAAVLFVVVMATDMLDGHYSRKWGQTSDYGKLWDPIADKAIVIITMLAMCVADHLFGWWGAAYLLLTVAREIGITVVRAHKVSGPGVVVAANWYGKIKTLLLAVAMPLLMSPVPLLLQGAALLTFWIVMITMLVASMVASLVSAVQYVGARG